MQNTFIRTEQNTLLNSSDNFKNYFDSILYINVLEHIQDDRKEITTVYNCLKQNGYACIFVPALPCLYSNFDKKIGHYRRYKKIQLESLFTQDMFEIVKLHYVDFIGIIPWYIFFVLLKKDLDSNSTHLYDTLVVPLIANFEKLIRVPIGKNLILIARKK